MLFTKISRNCFNPLLHFQETSFKFLSSMLVKKQEIAALCSYRPNSITKALHWEQVSLTGFLSEGNWFFQRLETPSLQRNHLQFAPPPEAPCPWPGEPLVQCSLFHVPSCVHLSGHNTNVKSRFGHICCLDHSDYSPLESTYSSCEVFQTYLIFCTSLNGLRSHQEL